MTSLGKGLSLEIKLDVSVVAQDLLRRKLLYFSYLLQGHKTK